MQKNFDSWMDIKKQSQQNNLRLPFKERDVWWCKLGANIGEEEDGKGKLFLRPVLIIKKFNKRIFIALPLSSISKENNYFYHSFEFKNKVQSIILSQIKLLDSKRLIDRMGTIPKNEFLIIKEKAKKLIF